MIIPFILAVCVLGMIGSLFMLHRNNWVYKQRGKLIDEKFDEYEDYWDYDKMMSHFWIWDVEKMKNND